MLKHAYIALAISMLSWGIGGRPAHAGWSDIASSLTANAASPVISVKKHKNDDDDDNGNNHDHDANHKKKDKDKKSGDSSQHGDKSSKGTESTATTPSGPSQNDNVLWGDYFYTDPQQKPKNSP